MRVRSFRLPVLLGSFLGLLVLPGSTATAVEHWTITDTTVMTSDHTGPVNIGADNITLDCAGFTIDATGTGWSAIDIYGKSDVTIRNCTVTSDVFGIAGNYVANLVLEGNTALDNGAAGVGTGYAVDATLVGNVATGNEHGFQLHGSNTTVIGNTATGNRHGGFLELGEATRYEGNTATANETGFIVAPHVGYTPADHEFVGNEAIDNTYHGFSFHNAIEATLIENVASGNEHGFVLSGSGAQVIDNTASDNQVNGFDDRGTGGHYEGNTATANAVGFAIYSLDPVTPIDVTMVDNTATRQAVGFHISSTGPTAPLQADLMGNVAVRNTDGFVISDGTGISLTGNQIKGNERLGLVVRRVQDVVLDSNMFVVNGDSGAKLIDVDGGSVTGNRFLRNTYAGVHVIDSTGVTLDSNTLTGNGGRALLLAYGGDHLVTGNVLRNNGRLNHSEGVGVMSSSDNLIIGNESDHNATHGFLAYVDGTMSPPPPALGNVFQENSACHNGLQDGYDQDTDSTWIDNDFCTTYNIP